MLFGDMIDNDFKEMVGILYRDFLHYTSKISDNKRFIILKCSLFTAEFSIDKMMELRLNTKAFLTYIKNTIKQSIIEENKNEPTANQN